MWSTKFVKYYILDPALKERLASCVNLASSELLWCQFPRVDNEDNISTHLTIELSY